MTPESGPFLYTGVLSIRQTILLSARGRLLQASEGQDLQDNHCKINYNVF